MLDVPPPGATDVAVGSGADPPPVGRAPITEIVPAARRVRARPVAHLVRGKSAADEPVLGEQVLVGHVVVVRPGELASTDGRGQSGALLDDEAYALRSSGSAAKAASRLAAQSESDSPGLP